MTCLACAFGLSACGGNKTEGDGTLMGSVTGPSFQARSAGFDGDGQDILMLSFADVPNLCVLSQSAMPSTASVRWLSIFICAGQGSAAGDYVVAPGNPGTNCTRGEAWAWMRAMVAGAPNMDNSASGSVTITSGANTLDTAAAPVAGSLQVSFGDGSAYSGSFSTTYCATLNQ